MSMISRKMRKKKGFIMIQTVLALILLSACAVGFFQIYSGSFSALAAARSGSQAQQAAELVSEYLKMQDYSSIPASKTGTLSSLFGTSLTDSTLSNLTYAWTLGTEKTFSSGDKKEKIRVATVSIKKTGETGSRATISVPLSSSGSGGNYYVKNLNQPSKTVSIKYDNKMLYGDVDGESMPFQSYLLVPDYAHPTLVMRHMPHTNSYYGEYVQKHLDHPYLHTVLTGGIWTWDPNPAMRWIIPEHGYIYSTALLNPKSNGMISSFMVCVRREGRTTILMDFFNDENKFSDRETMLSPVRKGDEIYWGTRTNTESSLPWKYEIQFYPCLKELS